MNSYHSRDRLSGLRSIVESLSDAGFRSDGDRLSRRRAYAPSAASGACVKTPLWQQWQRGVSTT
jgi:hypothetical protein